MFVLNATLQSTKLFLFLPVVERCDQHDDQHRYQDRYTLNPAGFWLCLIRVPRIRRCSSQHLCRKCKTLRHAGKKDENTLVYPDSPRTGIINNEPDRRQASTIRNVYIIQTLEQMLHEKSWGGF